MSITPGVRIGVYEVLGLLGEGGMGAVYRARDTKLNRDVALKVLLPAVANDPERLARFSREAQVLASLNHPHIAGIYGLEGDASASPSGVVALVMELVDGEDLSARLARGPIPLDEALPLARQIAEALEAAHEQGIVHRDLKPANIKVRPDGTVKVLDFGLAKAIEAPGSGLQAPGPAVTQSPTITSPAFTQAGMILGTAAYMAPEQAKGRTVDKRADIWAFGCVLYEMLTGRRAFEGEDIAEVLSRVLQREPDFDALPASTPPRVRELLARCLVKDPRQRLRDIGDARLVLDGAFESSVQATLASAASPARGGRGWLALAATATAALAIGAGAATWLTPRASVGTEPRVFQVESGDGIATPKVSPDGRSVAFVRNGRLAVRALDTGETEEVPGTDGASLPFWSPDSQSIAYFDVGKRLLLAVPAQGGATRTLVADIVFSPFGADWGPGGIVFAHRLGQGLWILPDGGKARQFAALDAAAGESSLAYPHWLPDGRVLAVVARSDGRGQSIAVFAEHRRTTLIDVNEGLLAWPVLADARSVVFERRGADSGLWKVDVSRDFSSSAGAPVPVLPDGAYPSVSVDGMLVSLSGVRSGDRQLTWVDRAGQTLSGFGRPQKAFRSLALSPDGRTVAVGNGPAEAAGRPSGMGIGDGSVWLHQQGTAQRLPSCDGCAGTGRPSGASPAWSPTGDRIAYMATTPDRAHGLFVVSSSGTGDARLIVKAARLNGNPAWSPDGRFLVYAAGDTGNEALWIISTEAGATPRRLLENATQPAISPDGRLLAYASATTGRAEVYVTTFPEPGQVWPVSGDGGRYPRWSPRGGELFFVSGANADDDPASGSELSAVKINTLGAVTVGAPEVLFNAVSLGFRLNVQASRGYDVGPDGERFLVQTSGREGTPTITAIQNLRAWMARPH